MGSGRYMNFSDPSESYERKNLLAKIADAQEVWADCYLYTSDNILAVHVRPTDSPELSIRQFEAAGIPSLCDVNFSYREPTSAGIIFSGSSLVGSELTRQDFERIFEEHPLEALGSLAELSSLFEEHFGSSRDSRVWGSFLENLPDDLSEEVVIKLVAPLLQEGGLHEVPEQAELYLKRRGWSEERISDSYDEGIRATKRGRADFFEATGWLVEKVKSTNDLSDAVFSALTSSSFGYEQVLEALCAFINGQGPNTNPQKLKEIVDPLFSLFGYRGYETLQDAMYDLFDLHHIDCSPYPRYQPLSPPHLNWWEDPVLKFSKKTSKAVHEITCTEDLVSIVYSLVPGLSNPLWWDMEKEYVVTLYVKAQSSYADVYMIKNIVEPLIPYIGKHGYSELQEAIRSKGWSTQWKLKDEDYDDRVGNPWGVWDEFDRKFGYVNHNLG
jgi:hypothetical protein